ncbi:MAG: thiamine diphosphokinase [Candidatus Actinomarina sp.]
MKNALIINGGLNSTKRDQLDNYDFIVAVDSGAEHAYKLFLKPDLIIGDLDSIDEKTIKRAEKDSIQILKYETNKNETDFELALKHVLDQSIKDITIIGGEYGEIDHLFSVLTVIISYQNDELILWIHGNQSIIIPNSKKIKIGNNVKFSILPFTDLKNLNISGAQWNLENENIKFGKSFTLRNISIDKNIEVSVDDGKFCLIYNN